IFAKAISNLWRQKLFSNVQVFVTKLEDEKVWIEISLTERPRLGKVKFEGIKKSEIEDLEPKLSLVKQTIITENTLRETEERIIKHFSEKGNSNVSVRIEQAPDPAFVNSNAMTIYIDKGDKVRIDEVRYFGNESVDALRLKKQMKGTKEMTKLTLYPDNTPSPYGKTKPFSFSEWMKEWGFLSLTKTKRLLDPYFRFKLFSNAKYDPVKFEADKNKVLDYYNSVGFRDAQILEDTIINTASGNINIDLHMEEGRRYYFGNITW